MKLLPYLRATSFRFLLAIGLLGVAVARVHGADKGQAASPDSETFTVDFPGGSLAQLLTQLKNAQNWSVDIVGSKEDLEAASLPPFSVHNIFRNQFLGMLSNILSKRGFLFDPQGASVAVLSRREENMGNFVSQDLSPFLNTRSVDDIVDAIRTACAMNPSSGGRELKIKFHPQTRLLLIAGNDLEVSIAIRVLNSLVPQPKDEKLNSNAKPADTSK